MFVYLAKKIGIPTESLLTTLSWENKDGYLVCGGTKKYLKILKLEVQRDQDEHARGIAGSLNITTNQTLSGHADTIAHVRWNTVYDKVATVDSNGGTIIWGFRNGAWMEDMVNNRQRSAVKDIQWSPNGEKIFIAYVDGEIIMGTSEGKRLWGREVQSKVEYVQWSPDSKHLLMSTEEGRVHVYDSSGNFMFQISSFGHSCKMGDNVFISKIAWSHAAMHMQTSWFEEDEYRLALVQKPDKIIFARHERERQPIIIQTQMTITCLKWNYDGTVLAVGGPVDSSVSNTDESYILVTFFDCYGNQLRTIKFQAKVLNEMSWERTNIRLALAADSYIYIANCRPNYQWSYIKSPPLEGSRGTVAYFKQAKKPNEQNSVCFWNLRNNDLYSRPVQRLYSIAACEDRCLIAFRPPVVAATEITPAVAHRKSSAPIPISPVSPTGNVKEITLAICDSMGATVKSKIIDYEPKWACVTATTAILVNKDGYHVHVWNYQSLLSDSLDGFNNDITGSGGKTGLNRIAEVIEASKTKEIVFNVDFLRIGTVVPSALWPPSSTLEQSGNPITAVAAKNNTLLIARQDCTVHHLSCRDLFHFADHIMFKEQKFPEIQKMFINCDESKIAVIDITGMVHIGKFENQSLPKSSAAISKSSEKFPSSTDLYRAKSNLVLNKPQNQQGSTIVPFELADAWNVLWASDDSDRFAVLEKTKLSVYKGYDPEEPMVTSGYLCDYESLELVSVLLDELVVATQPSFEHLVIRDTQVLRDAKQLLQTDLNQAITFVQNKSHPHIWKLIGDEALALGEYGLALKSFLNGKDYASVKFIQKLQNIEDTRKKRAECLAWFGRYEEAERIYIDMDRKDLALDLWCTVGNYERALKLTGPSPSKALMNQLKKELSAHYIERQQWDEALKYYSCSREYVDLCIMREEYDQLEKIIDDLPPADQLLEVVGFAFKGIGMYKQACKAFIKQGYPQKALDTCVFLREWGEARHLANKYNLSAELFINEYANYLITTKQTCALIELYNETGLFDRCGEMLYEIGQLMWSFQKPVMAKRCFVLSAMEFEKMPNASTDLNASSLSSRSEVWREVKCTHFFLQAQRLYYNRQYNEALMCVCQCLKSKIISNEQMYGLMVLIAIKCQSLKHLAVAVSRLVEQVETPADYILKDFKNDYLLSIYMQLQTSSRQKSKSDISNGDFDDLNAVLVELMQENPNGMKVCAATGTLIKPDSQSVTCKICQNSISQSAVEHYKNCPLCHTPYQ